MPNADEPISTEVTSEQPGALTRPIDFLRHSLTGDVATEMKANIALLLSMCLDSRMALDNDSQALLEGALKDVDLSGTEGHLAELHQKIKGLDLVQ